VLFYIESIAQGGRVRPLRHDHKHCIAGPKDIQEGNGSIAFVLSKFRRVKVSQNLELMRGGWKGL
jgi:hypothetical protein